MYLKEHLPLSEPFHLFCSLASVYLLLEPQPATAGFVKPTCEGSGVPPNSVSGVVTLDGRPVPEAAVVFSPAQVWPARGGPPMHKGTTCSPPTEQETGRSSASTK